MSCVLFPGDSYDTTPAPVAPLAAGLPSLVFFWNLLRIVHRDGVLAAQNRYSGDDWATGSIDTLRALERCGVQVHVRGMDHLNALTGPCVFISNHMSTLETFVLPCFIQPRMNITFVVKQNLTTYPWFGSVLRSRDPVIVSRTNARQDLVAVLEGGEERLKNGTSIIVFPQSTRSATFDTEHFNSIGIKLAKRAGVPVVPIALRTDAWGNGALIKDFGRIQPSIPVHFTFGAPFTVEGNGKADHARVCSFIQAQLRKWNAEIMPMSTPNGQ